MHRGRLFHAALVLGSGSYRQLNANAVAWLDALIIDPPALVHLLLVFDR